MSKQVRARRAALPLAKTPVRGGAFRTRAMGNDARPHLPLSVLTESQGVASRSILRSIDPFRSVPFRRSRAQRARPLERRRLGLRAELRAKGARRWTLQLPDLLDERGGGARGGGHGEQRSRDQLAGVAALAQPLLFVARVVAGAVTSCRLGAATTAVFHPAGAGCGDHRLHEDDRQHHHSGQGALQPTLEHPLNRSHTNTLAILSPRVKCGMAPHAQPLHLEVPDSYAEVSLSLRTRGCAPSCALPRLQRRIAAESCAHQRGSGGDATERG